MLISYPSRDKHALNDTLPLARREPQEKTPGRVHAAPPDVAVRRYVPFVRVSRIGNVRDNDGGCKNTPQHAQREKPQKAQEAPEYTVVPKLFYSGPILS